MRMDRPIESSIGLAAYLKAGLRAAGSGLNTLSGLVPAVTPVLHSCSDDV